MKGQNYPTQVHSFALQMQLLCTDKAALNKNEQHFTLVYAGV